MDRNAAHNRPIIVVVMGVSASGKTTVARLLAERLHAAFQEGDALHPAANVEKMKNGIPLTDADRLPWLHRIAQRIDEWRLAGQSGVLTCSALKRSYREIIVGDRPEVRLVYLKGSHALIRRRIEARHGHFMPASLLDSQFATLEEPGPDERPVTVDIDAAPERIADEVVSRLGD
ncbi:MAG: gluconokinase [Alphaproteobacteria bacterium]|nr:gluconokinase [Alphaproteobacteria bacterium]MBV8408653.1 gluconokinase [Alphaproteobacteria bacterium]